MGLKTQPPLCVHFVHSLQGAVEGLVGEVWGELVTINHDRGLSQRWGWA